MIAGLTWGELDRLVDEDPIGLRDRAWTEIQELRGELERLRADLVRMDEDAAQALVRQTELKGMTVEEGATVLELGPPRELVIAFVDAARKMLGDAPNYSETRIDFPATSMEVKAAGEFDRYVFTVQRAGKVTPHEARRNAEAERDALFGLLRGMARRASELRRQYLAEYIGRCNAEQFARYAPIKAVQTHRVEVSASHFGREPMPPIPSADAVTSEEASS